MKHLSRRQEEIWRKKMVEIEKRVTAWYQNGGHGDPDGSFVMSAFKDGYYLGRKMERGKP